MAFHPSRSGRHSKEHQRWRGESNSNSIEYSLEREEEAALELFDLIFHSSAGEMELGEALSRLSSRNKYFIRDYRPELFMLSFRDILKFTSEKRSQDKVKAIMPIKFCPEEAGRNGCPDGSTCKNLHLCPYFVKGNCMHKEKCWMSHQIKDAHTMSLLREIRLADITPDMWLRVLKKVLADTQLERGASTHNVPNICKHYNNQGNSCVKGEKCAFLHVCQHFVDGTCKFGTSCMRDHDLFKEKHNRDIFRHFGLRHVEPKQLLIILRGRERTPRKVRATSPTPGIRSNKKEVTHKADHHDFVPLLSPPAKRTKVTDQARTPEDRSTDICGFFLRGQCNYRQQCMNLHRELPYQWQLQDGSGWKDLSQDWNIMLERGFSDPSSNEIIFYDQGQSFKTDFDKMIAVAEDQAGQPRQMRRLSTESSAAAPPGHIFSTRWLWYWQDERGKWQSYNSPGVGIKPNTTSSISLEKDFLQDQENHYFNVGHSSYKLSYKRMSQKNVKTQTKRAVRRRPEFVAKEKMKSIAKTRKEAIKLSFTLQNSISSCVYDITALPTHWDSMDDKTGYVLIELPSASQEYINVKEAFMKTMASNTCVKKIERVQNPDLWTAFVQKKGRMTKKSNDVPPKEMPQLFHGTAADVVDAVCQQGFDWRMCGKHGTLYGKGSYFASDASYSHRYTDQYTGLLGYRKMLVARVIVGSYVLGSSSLTRPPPKDSLKPHGDLHDSCVDDIIRPRIYVVFDNNQCYPEYLITYN